MSEIRNTGILSKLTVEADGLFLLFIGFALLISYDCHTMTIVCLQVYVIYQPYMAADSVGMTHLCGKINIVKPGVFIMYNNNK